MNEGMDFAEAHDEADDRQCFNTNSTDELSSVRVMKAMACGDIWVFALLRYKIRDVHAESS
jgi:hypothetical protein